MSQPTEESYLLDIADIGSTITDSPANPATLPPPAPTGPPSAKPLSPHEVGLCYIRAVKILRTKKQFPLGGMRGRRALGRIPHILNSESTSLHPDAQFLAHDIESIALQAVAQLGPLTFSTEFIVNLEAFSRIDIDEEDEEKVIGLAIAYEPVRLDAYLRYTKKGSSTQSFHELATLSMQRTNRGVRIVKKEGLFTSMGVVVLCMIPVVLYLYNRVGIADVEKMIQVAIGIIATTLFAAAGPLHKMLFNNWDLAEALALRMTLDEDTVANVRKKNQRYVGMGLIVNGQMDVISGDAGYASPYSKKGINPGPMTLTVLTYHKSYRCVVDQDGRLVLVYCNRDAVELVPQGMPHCPMPLKGKPVDFPDNFYILNVGTRPADYSMGFAAENCLVE